MSNARTGDQALVREINLSIILNALRDRSPLSRASLAAFTGLNKTTVSSLVQQLITAGFVSEIGADRAEDPGSGRPGILLELNPHAGCIIGTEIGVDFVSVVVADFTAKIVWRHQEKTAINETQEHIVGRALGIIRDGIAHTRQQYHTVFGLGIGVPGLVDVKSGTLLFAPNLKWRNVPLGDIFRAEFDFPVYVDNEANMATMGETYFGVARGAKSVLYVSAGVGLGGGFVLDGRVVAGTAGFAGEVGHMTMDIDGLPCNCGNHGCWETLVSQEAVFRRISEAIEGGRETLLARHARHHAGFNISQVVAAARAGDEVALEVLERTGFYLGVGIANLVNALNPEIVIFGGILSLASEFLLPVVKRELNERALHWSVDSMKVHVAAHGSDACAMGGIAAVYHQLLSQPFRTARPALLHESRTKRHGADSSGNAGSPARSGKEMQADPLQHIGSASHSQPLSAGC